MSLIGDWSVSHLCGQRSTNFRKAGDRGRMIFVRRRSPVNTVEVSAGGETQGLGGRIRCKTRNNWQNNSPGTNCENMSFVGCEAEFAVEESTNKMYDVCCRRLSLILQASL